MWPLPPIRNEHIHINLSQGSVSCSLMSYEHGIFSVQALEQYELPHIDHDFLFNPTELRRILEGFITKHALTHAYAHYTLQKPYCRELLVSHSKNTATLAELISNNQKHMYYVHEYLGPHNAHALFYVGGVAEALLLQLHTLHNQLMIQLQSITPSFAVQLMLNQFLQQSTISQAALIKQIDTNAAHMPHLFSPENYTQILALNHQHSFNEQVVYAIASHVGAIT